MGKLIFRFDVGSSVQGWNPVDDRVMGGASRSQLLHDPCLRQIDLVVGGGEAGPFCLALRSIQLE